MPKIRRYHWKILIKIMSILTVIQARMASVRLPGKSLAQLNGYLSLALLIERIKNTKLCDRIIIATTERPEDDQICSIARKYHLNSHRGSSENVLERYTEALKRFPSDYVVRVTADNPLTSIEMFDATVQKMINNNFDYMHVPDLPIGSAVDIFTKDSLNTCQSEATSDYQREHINAFIIDNPDQFKIGKLEIPEILRRANIRLTIDTIEDLTRIRLIRNSLNNPTLATLAEIIEAHELLINQKRSISRTMPSRSIQEKNLTQPEN